MEPWKIGFNGADDVGCLDELTCRICGRDFFGLRDGSDLCSLHYFEYGRKVYAKKLVADAPTKRPSLQW